MTDILGQFLHVLAILFFFLAAVLFTGASWKLWEAKQGDLFAYVILMVPCAIFWVFFVKLIGAW